MQVQHVKFYLALGKFIDMLLSVLPVSDNLFMHKCNVSSLSLEPDRRKQEELDHTIDDCNLLKLPVYLCQAVWPNFCPRKI